jgi:hypothetical protein
MNQQYTKIILQKCSVLLTQAELNSLLLKDMDIYRQGLIRAKKLERFESKNRQFADKFSKSEAEALNKLLQ